MGKVTTDKQEQAKIAEQVKDSFIKASTTAYAFDLLRQSLIQRPDPASTETYAQAYIRKLLQLALDDPNSDVGRILARQFIQEDLFKKLDSDTDKQLSRDRDFNEWRIRKSLYKEQKEVYDDTQNRRVIVIGSRRIGKTELAARLLVRDALSTAHNALYINLTFDNAIKQCYNLTFNLLNDLNIPIETSSKVDGYITLQNKSTILFRGNKDKAAADKLLGFKYSAVVIDEVQNQPNLRYLLDTVITPTTADYENSTIYCLGTPPRVPHTVAEELWNNDRWKHYGWNMFSNPYINKYTDVPVYRIEKDGTTTDSYTPSSPEDTPYRYEEHSMIQDLLEAVLKEKNTTEDAPFIQREFYGKFFYDSEARIIKDPLTYAMDIERAVRDGVVHFDEVYGGIDFGFEDYNAIVTIGWNKKTRTGYILTTSKFNKASVTDITNEVRRHFEYCKKLLTLSAVRSPHKHIWFYGDNSDKSIIKELAVSYRIPIQTAIKYDKMEALSSLSILLQKSIYTPLNKTDYVDGSLTDEYETSVYKRDEATDAVLPEIDDDTFHPDSLMALLYASRPLILMENPQGEQFYEDFKALDDRELTDVIRDEDYLTPKDTDTANFIIDHNPFGETEPWDKEEDVRQWDNPIYG